MSEVAPLAFTIAEAVAASRVSRSKIYLAISSGELVARKRGARTLILRADLESWLASFPVIEPRPTAGRPDAVA